MQLIPAIREAILVLMAAVILAGVGYVVHPNTIAIGPGGPDGDGGGGESGAVRMITLEDARRHFEQGTALFADARPEGAFRSGHIQGAMHLNPDEFDGWSGDFFSKIPPEQVIITYCDGERCALSLELAEKLTWMGYENVYCLKDGWSKWNHHHLPIDQHID